MFIAKELFPNGTISYQTEQSFEVNGLEKNTQPVNCEILDTASEKMRNGDRRDYFFVLTKSQYALIRICTAMSSSGYDEYAVCHSAHDRDTTGVEIYVQHTLDTMKRMRKYNI